MASKCGDVWRDVERVSHVQGRERDSHAGLQARSSHSCHACPRPILVSQLKEVNDDRIDKLIRRVQKEKDKELRTKACGSEAQPESESFA